MGHQISYYDGLTTIRLDGRVNAQEVAQIFRTNLDSQSVPVIAILDLTLATSFDQQLKSLFYRILQHHHVSGVGIFGVNPEVATDVNDFLPVLRRVRKVAVGESESDLRAEFGLSAPQQKKLGGMLAYMKKGQQPST